MPKASYAHPDAVRLGKILKRLRTDRGWTLVKTAQRTGMNPTYLGVMENGGNMPTIPTLLELADVFNVQAADIIRELENARRRKPVTVQPLAETEEVG
jgi:XRE family transcriptional regulator, regulator of sulfur utilization